jgi:hypothetical protein
VFSKILVDSNKDVLYIIDNNNYYSNTFKFIVKDINGSVTCINGPSCNGTKVALNYNESLETYFYFKNTININVPDGQSVLGYDGQSAFKAVVKIDVPTYVTDAITCQCANTNPNFTVSCVNYPDPTSMQYEVTVTNTTYDTNPIVVVIYCFDNINNLNAFGINYLPLNPSVKVSFYYDWYLLTSGLPMLYLPSSYDTAAPLSQQGSNLIKYKGYAVFGLGLPYKFNAYNYTSKIFTKYDVVNWNASSLKINSISDPVRFSFCCLYSTVSSLTCRLTNTISVTPASSTPEWGCNFDPSANNYFISSAGLTKSWFDGITCNPINDPALDPGLNQVMCHDDLLQIKCMPSLPSGVDNYGTSKIFTQGVQLCISNVPQIKFKTTNAVLQFIGTSVKFNFKDYVDISNLLEEFIYSFKVNDSNMVDISGNLTIDLTNGDVTFPITYLTSVFTGSVTSATFSLTLIDAYERNSYNSLTINISTNSCPVFIMPSPYSLGNWIEQYTNEYILFDTSNTSINIISSYDSTIFIDKGPQLYLPAALVFTPNSLIKLVWTAPASTTYPNKVTIRISYPCNIASIPNNYIDLDLVLLNSLPFADFIMKPYIKCISGGSSFTINKNASNDIVSHFDNTSPVYPFIQLISTTNYNSIIYTNYFPNVAGNPVNVANNSGVYQLVYNTCDSGISDTLKIIQATDTNLPSYQNNLRTFLTYENKFYINVTDKFNHSRLAYYRFFSYNTIKFDINLETDFTTRNTILKLPINLITQALNKFANNIFIKTATCDPTVSGYNFITSLLNKVRIPHVLANFEQFDFTDNTNIAINNLCGFVDESEQVFYFRNDSTTNSVRLVLIYYPHYGMEFDIIDINIKSYTSTDINFNANVYDINNNAIIPVKSALPKNILLAYGSNLQDFLQFKVTYNNINITPEFKLISLDNNKVLDDNNSSNLLSNLVTKNTSNNSFQVSFSKNKLSANDNYKFTIHGAYQEKNQLYRFDTPTVVNSLNILMHDEVLNNITNIQPDFTAMFNNAFYLNVSQVSKQLYMTINLIDPVSLNPTQICQIDDAGYYNTFVDLNSYFNSATVFKTVNQCQLTVTENDYVIIQLQLTNASDFQDYIFKITSDAISTCNGLVIDQSLMSGDFLKIDLKSNIYLFSATSFNLYINVKHKFFEIDTLNNPEYTYLKIQGVQQWINLNFPITVNKFVKAPRVSKFWTTGQSIYDIAQSRTATMGSMYTYNFKILSDNVLTIADIALFNQDKTNLSAPNIFTVNISGCTNRTPSCSNKPQQEDYSYLYSCSTSLQWKPSVFQFDSGLVILKISDSSDSSLYTFYYFSIGDVIRVNTLPIITGVLCQQIVYDSVLLTNQQLVMCSVDSSNRPILQVNKTHLIKLLWDDPDSYPADYVSGAAYPNKTNDVLALYPYQLVFYLSVSPNIISSFTRLSYDTWLVTVTSANFAIIPGSLSTISFYIDDYGFDLQSNGSVLKNTQTTPTSSFIFQINETTNLVYIKDTYNLGQYDIHYPSIPFIFDSTVASPNYNNQKYSFGLTLASDDFIENPTMTFKYDLSIIGCSPNNLTFETNSSTYTDAPTLSLTSQPLDIKLNYAIINKDNTFNTIGCYLQAVDQQGTVSKIAINACQYLPCKNLNLISVISGTCTSPNDNCKYMDKITLSGINFSNPAKIMISNAECAKVVWNSNNSVDCYLPNLLGRNHLIWLYDDATSHLNGLVASASITFNELFKDTLPIITLPTVYIGNTHYIQVPNSIQLFGQNFRSSCVCELQCSKILYPKTFVKNSDLLICDYFSNLNKADFIFQTCVLKIKCLDHQSFKNNGNVYDLSTVSNGEIIYESVEQVNIYFDEVRVNKVFFRDIIDSNTIYEEYTPLINGTPIPHIHGGYIIQLIYDKIPQCYSVSPMFCDKDYFYIGLSRYTLKANCNIDASVGFNCQIIAPQLYNISSSYSLLFSFDKGLSFQSALNATTIPMGTVCQSGFYCPSYKQIPVDPGYFCELIPQQPSDLFCRYQRKCPQGFSQSAAKSTFCIPSPTGTYLNFFGSDGTNVKPKPCPKGFICTESGLPKYYNVCNVSFYITL